MITFDRIDIEQKMYMGSDDIGEMNVFQTSEWIKYIAEIRNAEPIIAVIKSEDRFLGYFTGLITRKFGMKILGSPFRGWATYFMGFNLLPSSPKHEILQALPKFAFKTLACQYLEVIDPNINQGDWDGSSYQTEHLHYYGIDLTLSEETLFARMDNTGRNCIRKAIKNGVVIEEAQDTNFADEYYAQYTDVLAKHSLLPPYTLDSVRKLIERLLPTGCLLLLRARNPEGVCIATGIFLALNKTGIFWGAASWRQYQQLRPNELIAWYGMKKLKAQGIQMLHFGGKCEHYKEKLGCNELQLFRLMKTRNKLLGTIIYPLMSPKSAEYRNWVLRRLSR